MLMASFVSSMVGFATTLQAPGHGASNSTLNNITTPMENATVGLLATLSSPSAENQSRWRTSFFVSLVSTLASFVIVAVGVAPCPLLHCCEGTWRVHLRCFGWLRARTTASPTFTHHGYRQKLLASVPTQEMESGVSGHHPSTQTSTGRHQFGKVFSRFCLGKSVAKERISRRMVGVVNRHPVGERSGDRFRY